MPTDPLRIVRTELDEGLALVTQDPPDGSPSVSLTYIGPAGTAYDPPGREGTALLAGELATVAAGTRDRRALARHLDALGATLHDQPSPECLEISAWGPASRWLALLDVLADAVLRPRFDAEDVARALRQLHERQLRERSQPDLRAEIELLRAIYPKDHPYHRTGSGDPASLRRIDRATLRRFHAGHYVPDGAAIVVTGAVPRETLRRAVEARFLGRGLPRAPARPEVPSTVPRARSLLRSMPGRTQVEVRVGALAVPRSDGRFPALYLANEVLGGQVLLSRLFQRVREKAGLAYHASSDLEAMGWGGYWELQAGTGPERAEAVEALLRKEFEAIARTPVPAAELDRIRESTIGSMALELETTSGAHDLAVSSAYYHLPESFYREWPGTLRALSPKEIRASVEATVDPERAVTVRVGPTGAG